MRLSIVIPGNDLDEAGLQLQDFIPAVEPEKIGWENPVLAVRDLGAKVCEEPRGYRCSSHVRYTNYYRREIHIRAM
jgi:hypothetical protein